MEKQVGELYLGLKADIDGLKKQIKNLSKQVKNEATKTGASIGKQISSGIIEAVGKIGGVIASFEALKQGLNLAGILEQNQVAFENMLGSASKAKKMIQDLTDFAKNTPFELIGLQDTAKQLIGMGFEAKQVIPMLQILGDAVAAVGGNQDTLNGVVLALAQIKNKGKLSAEELNQLAERGLPVYDILREKLHLTAKEMQNIGNAGISSGKAIQALMEGLQERYAGMMEAQSKTFMGMLSNLKDSIDLFLAQIGKALLPKIKQWLQVLLDFFAKWGKFLATQIGKLLSTLLDGFLSFAKSIVKVFSELGKVIVGENKNTVKGVGENWQSLFFYLRTGFKTIIFIVSSLVKAVGGMFAEMAKIVKKIFAAIVNYFVDKINLLIEGFNMLGDHFGFTMEKIQRVSWGASDEIGSTMKDMAKSVIKDWDNMTAGMAYDYLTTTKQIKDSTEKVGFTAKKFSFNIKGMFTSLGAGIKQTLQGASDNTKKLVKDVNDSISNIVNGLKKQINLYDKVKQKLIDIRDQYKKWKEEAHNAILEINHNLENLDQEKNNQLAERYVEIQKELAQIQEKLQKEQSKEKEKQDTNEITQLLEKQKQLEQELQIIKQNAPEQVLKEKEAYDKLTQTQKILLDYEKQRQKLLEQKAIYQAIEGQKGLLDNVIKVNETNGQLTAEYFDKEKQKWIEITDWENIQLAVRLENKRQALLQETQIQLEQLEKIKQATQAQTDQMKQIWDQYNQYLQVKTANTVAKLMATYQKLVSQLREVYLWQQKTKTIGSTTKGKHMGGLVGFASGGFTGGNTPLKVAGVVHQGEYVIPKWMTDTYKGLINSLENIRLTGAAQTTKNVNVNFGDVVVNKEIDLDKLAYDLQWRLGFI